MAFSDAPLQEVSFIKNTPTNINSQFRPIISLRKNAIDSDDGHIHIGRTAPDLYSAQAIYLLNNSRSDISTIENLHFSQIEKIEVVAGSKSGANEFTAFSNPDQPEQFFKANADTVKVFTK